ATADTSASATASAPKASAEANPDSHNGRLAKTPYAEALRLGQRLYLTPGDYTLRLKLGSENSETKLKVTAPEAYKPRSKPKLKLRGRDD
ncbi:MAG: hypothetical protein CO182_00065, partial [Lysobacterales bacterium CG_4_9_14_3_um_filter_62_6]